MGFKYLPNLFFGLTPQQVVVGKSREMFKIDILEPEFFTDLVEKVFRAQQEMGQIAVGQLGEGDGLAVGMGILSPTHGVLVIEDFVSHMAPLPGNQVFGFP